MSVHGRPEPQGALVTTIQVLMVRCGSTYLGVPADLSRGVLEPDNPSSEGAVSALGITYPLTDLAGRLGLSASSDSPGTRIILCARGAAQNAIRVDELLGLMDIEQRRIRSLPLHFTGPERDWFAGLYVFHDRIAFLINPAWLLGDKTNAGLPGNLTGASASPRLLAPPQAQRASGEDDTISAEQPELLY